MASDVEHYDSGQWEDCTKKNPITDCLVGPHRWKAKPAKADKTLGQQAATWLRSVADMLEKKNQAYGDSAGQPVRVFSKSDTIEQLKVRADDKLSRLTRGTAAGEDAVQDLVGYIALLAAAGWKGNG